MKSKLHALINIAGLAIGFASFVLIALFVRYELSFDSFFANSENIYRAEAGFRRPGGPMEMSARISAAARDALEQDFADIEQATLVFYTLPAIRRGDAVFNETVALVDENFLNIFKLDFVRGSADTALLDLNSVAISEATARKYFGDQDALGQILTFDGTDDVRITGIFRDLPETSHLDLPMIGLIDRSAMAQQFEHWFWSNFYVYFELRPDARIEDIEAQIPEFI